MCMIFLRFLCMTLLIHPHDIVCIYEYTEQMTKRNVPYTEFVQNFKCLHDRKYGSTVW
jgi:hypothetical protein